MPHRVQRRRTKGWKMPTNTVYVGRPTKWGNPFRAGRSPRRAVLAFKRVLHFHAAIVASAKIELRGKNLACWCKIGDPCHADVLLEIANS